MRLAEFITKNTEAILAEWEAFAKTMLPAAEHMTPLALRDHAPDILRAVAKDITTPQTSEEQAEKSKGQTPVAQGAPETAAQTHAVLRARSGFDVTQLVAEYRALRASVLRLWINAVPLDEPAVEEVIRFNEAIDQAVAESVGHFHAQMEQSRNLFLGMLGHDMRTPLNAIVTTASYLAALNAGEQVSAAADRLIRSGASMRALLDDLVDFNRTQLGLGLQVAPADVDLADALADELQQLRAAYPDRRIDFEANGDTRGRWDAGRLQQVLRNLVSNAIEHGDAGTAVRVTLFGDDAGIRLEVTNQGSAIDGPDYSELFDPLKRGPARSDGRENPQGLGLGLFIVREIAHAHGGKVDLSFERQERTTTVAVSLPR